MILKYEHLLNTSVQKQFRMALEINSNDVKIYEYPVLYFVETNCLSFDFILSFKDAIAYNKIKHDQHVSDINDKLKSFQR